MLKVQTIYRKSTKNKNKKIKERNKQLILISSIFICGIILGFITGFFTVENKAIILTENLKDFFTNYDISQNSLSLNFIETFFKHSKLIIPIWFLGFIWFGPYISFFLIFINGISFGFTIRFLINIFNSNNFLCILSIYLFQNIFLLPWILFLTYNSIHFSKTFQNTKKNSGINSPEYYIFLLILSLAVIAIASLIEIYIVPQLITDYIINFL